MSCMALSRVEAFSELGKDILEKDKEEKLGEAKARVVPVGTSAARRTSLLQINSR